LNRYTSRRQQEPAQSVNFDLCGGLNTDLDCYAKVRLEIKDGIDRAPLLNITRPNSIENRLLKLLAYLRRRFPNDGWAQFLANDSTMSWPSIIVSGHSQGGGHAGIIGRYHPVARVIMFAAMDYNSREGKPANWIAAPTSTPNATPAERFFGFSHQRPDFPLNDQTRKVGVTLKVFDVNGREGATLVGNDVLTAGQHVRSWEAKNVTSGVYFYRIFAGDFQETKKMILMR